MDFPAGYRLQYLASKGLAADVSDVWTKVRKNFARSYQTAVTAADGKQYLIPIAKYPWAVMYRKSIFKAAGIDAASIVTWSDFLGACSILKSKGLTPIAFGSAVDGRRWELLISSICEPTDLNFMVIFCRGGSHGVMIEFRKF